METQFVTIAILSRAKAEYFCENLEKKGIPSEIEETETEKGEPKVVVKVRIKDVPNVFNIPEFLDFQFSVQQKKVLSDERLITVASLSFANAHMFKGALEISGIECILTELHTILPEFPNLIKVKVRESDLEKSLEVYLRFKERYRKDEFLAVDALADVANILVAVDFSEESKSAAVHAIMQANITGAKVHLVHVYYSSFVPPASFSESFNYEITNDKETREIEMEAEVKMSKFFTEIIDIPGLNPNSAIITKYLLRGMPEDEILALAALKAADIIYIGAKGLGNSIGLHTGRTAVRIAELAKIPVIAFPKLNKHIEFEEISILYATDCKETDFLAIRKLMRLFWQYNPKVYLAYVGNEETTIDAVFMNALQEHFKTEYPEYQLFITQIAGSNSVDALHNYASEHQIGIIAINTHKADLISKLFVPDVINSLLHQCQIPLLIFHAK